MTKLLRALAVAVATAALCILPALSARAEVPEYVALGDSYASGLGTRSYLADGTSCQRSALSYAALIATARGYQLNLRACSGATVADVTTAQLGALSTRTRFVTISVGGNDAGFASVLTECALPGWMSNCNGAVDRAVNFITNTLPGRLTTLYSQIRAKAPNAEVVVVGYPRLFNGTDCHALTFFTAAEMSRLNAGSDLLNSKARTAANAAGFRFADPVGTFAGHAVCDRTPYINNLSIPVTESFHPNRAGHSAGYAPAVSSQLTGRSVLVNSQLLSAAERTSQQLTATQRPYAATDRNIQPKSFQLPNLRSPAAIAAARKAGVDLNSWSSITSADVRTSSAQQQAWQANQPAGTRA